LLEISGNVDGTGMLGNALGGAPAALRRPSAYGALPERSGRSRPVTRDRVAPRSARTPTLPKGPTRRPILRYDRIVSDPSQMEDREMGDHRMPRRTSTCFVVTLSLSLSLSLAACSADAAPDGPYPVADAPLFRISADLESGRTTSSELTMAYIERIETMDEPLNGVIAIAPDALDQAAASDERRTAGQARGPLDGIPILLKDNLDALGMPTTAG